MTSHDELDRKALRWLAAVEDFPHLGIGGLDVAAKALGIEKRVGVPIFRKPSANRGQHRRIAGKPHCQSLVVSKTRGDEFGDADSIEETCRHPASKGAALAGDE